MKVFYSTATVVSLLCGFLPVSLADDPGEGQHLKLLRNTGPQRNLRSGNNDYADGADENHLLPPRNPDLRNLEEDEQLWERILQQEFSIPPTPRPTRPPTTIRPIVRPTMSPTRAPVTPQPVEPEEEIFPEECDLEMNIECVAIEGEMDEIRRPCQEVLEPEEDDECMKKVQYVYRISNTCEGPNCDTATITNFNVVRNGNLKDMMNILPPGASLDPDETVFYIESGLEFDFCANKTVDTNSIIIGTTAPGDIPGICEAEGSNLLTIGFVPDLPCNVAVDLACFVEDDQGRKTNCKDVPIPTDDSECFKQVSYAYIVTNVGEREKTILELSRTRDGETRDLRGLLDRSDVMPGQFAVARESGTLDFCQQRIVTTTVDVESEAKGVGELSCIDQDVLSFSLAITCDVDVKIECFADSDTGFITPCDQHDPFQVNTKDVGCEHPVKFVYSIENTGPGDEVIEAVRVSREGKTTDILDKRFNLEPDDVRAVTEFITVDYCEGDASQIATQVRVDADMIPVGGACFAEDSYEWTPTGPPCDVTIEPFIRCTLVDDTGRTVSCLDYIEEIDDPENPRQCLREVKYELTMINTGLACLEIESVTARLRSKTDGLDITPNTQVNLCPGEKYVIEVINDQDLCDDDLEEEILVEVNGGPPEVCGGFGSLTYIPPPEGIEECFVELDLSCRSPDGSACKIIRDGQSECDGHPSYLEFKFSAGSCDRTTNQQNGKFSCNDVGPINNGGAYIIVESKKGSALFAATVARGVRFKLGNGYNKLDANISINIYDSKGGKLLQRMSLHTSCSEPLYTNDTFGGLTLVGFGDKKNQFQAVENEFLIDYKITNTFDTIALLEEIIFYLDGNEVARTYLDLAQLEAGNTFDRTELLELPASSNDQVELSATLYAESLSAIACNAEDSIDIEVGEPPEPECEPIKCLHFPHAFKFKFTGGLCDDSDNHQTYWCTDHGEMGDDFSHIIVGDVDFEKVYFKGEVKKGHEFEVKADGAFKDYISVKVMKKDYYGEMTVAQIVKFMGSCEQPIYLGDIFGVVEVVGWKNKNQGKVYFPDGHKC